MCHGVILDAAVLMPVCQLPSRLGSFITISNHDPSLPSLTRACLCSTPNLELKIRLRAPYVAPLNILQVCVCMLPGS
jgi:hypothetical protein